MRSTLRLLFIGLLLSISFSEVCHASRELAKLEHPPSSLNPARPTDFCRTVLTLMQQQGAKFEIVQDENGVMLVSELVHTTAEGYKNFVEALRNVDAEQRSSVGVDSLKRIIWAGSRRALDVGLNIYSLIKQRKLVGWAFSDFQTTEDVVSDMKWFVPDPNVRLNPSQMQFTVRNRIVVTKVDSEKLLKLLERKSEADQKQICGPLPTEACMEIVPALQKAIVEGNRTTGQSVQALALETTIDFVRNIQDSPERKDEYTLKVTVRAAKIFTSKPESK